MSADRRNLPSLTAFRAVAAVAVFGFHAVGLLAMFGRGHLGRAAGKFFAAGPTGVSFFFLLSGFVLMWSHRGDAGRRRRPLSGAPQTFWRQRAARILPAYVAAWVLGFAVLTGLHHRPPVGGSVASLFLVQSWTSDSNVVFAVNIVAWSLAVEAFFYLLFPYLLPSLLRLEARLRPMLMVSLALIPLGLAVVQQLGHGSSGYLWLVAYFPLARLPEFLIGALLALEIREGRWRRIPLAPAVVFAFAGFLLAGRVPAAFMWVVVTLLPYTLLIAAAAQADLAGQKSVLHRGFAVRLGAWSYSFYLLQVPIGLLFAHYWHPADRSTALQAAGFIGYLALVWVAAALLYRVVERPLQARFAAPRTIALPDDEAAAAPVPSPSFEQAVVMSLGRYLTGFVILLVVLGAAALIGYATRRRYLPEWRAAQARLAEAVVGIATIVIESLTLGLIHEFNRAGVLIASGLLLGAGFSWLRRIPACDSDPRSAPARLGPWGALIAGGSAILVLWQWAVQTIPAVQQGFFEFDTLDYHLPMALHWVQSGVIGPVHQTVPGLPVGYYPANAEIFHAIGMLAWQSDVLSLVLNLFWLLLALLAAWVIGQRFQAIPIAMAGTALVMAVPLMARNQPGSAMTDTPSIALLLAAVALLDRSGAPRRAPFAFAGLAAGLAIGTKLTVLPMLVLFTLGIPLLDRRDRWRPFAAWTIAMAAGGGFWYVRNLVVIGNPMPASKFPFGYLGLPTPHFSQFDQAPQSVLHYATDGAVLRQFAHDLGHGLGRFWLPLIVFAVAGLVVSMLPGRDRLQRLWGATSLLGLLIYAATPTTAGGPEGKPLLFEVDVRYALPMLAIGFVLLGSYLAEHRRLSVAAEALVALMLAATVALRWHIPGAETQRRTVTVAGAVLLVAVAALVWSARRGRFRAFHARRVGTVGTVGTVGIVGTVAGALLLGTAGGAFASYSEDHRYAAAGTTSAQSVYAWFQHLPGDQRIATTGLALAYPLSGPRLSSRITYLGPDVKGALDDYASCQAWTAAVAKSHVNYLVTAPLLAGSAQEPAASSWAQHDPAFVEVFRRDAIRVFEVVGTASPNSGCTR